MMITVIVTVDQLPSNINIEEEIARIKKAILKAHNINLDYIDFPVTVTLKTTDEM